MNSKKTWCGSNHRRETQANQNTKGRRKKKGETPTPTCESMGSMASLERGKERQPGMGKDLNMTSTCEHSMRVCHRAQTSTRRDGLTSRYPRYVAEAQCTIASGARPALWIRRQTQTAPPAGHTSELQTVVVEAIIAAMAGEGRVRQMCRAAHALRRVTSRSLGVSSANATTSGNEPAFFHTHTRAHRSMFRSLQ
jgi:hypothetical protein